MKRKFTAVPGRGIFTGSGVANRRIMAAAGDDMNALAMEYEQMLAELLAGYGLADDDIASISVRPRSTKTFTAAVKATSKKHHGKSFKLSSFKAKDAETAIADFAYEVNAQLINGDKLQPALEEDAYVKLFSVNGMPIGYYREFEAGRGAMDVLVADPYDAAWIAEPERKGQMMSRSYTTRQLSNAKLLTRPGILTTMVWFQNRLDEMTYEELEEFRKSRWAIFLFSFKGIDDDVTIDYEWIPLSEAETITKEDGDAVIDFSISLLKQHLDERQGTSEEVIVDEDIEEYE